jgi:GH15 family glucan-1,4-alpha-glucosidase
MVKYRDLETKLPGPSYDLWEEKRGMSSFTCASVFAALNAAADLSKLLGKEVNERRYRDAAEEIKEAILKYLWDEKEGIFIKMIQRKGDALVRDNTLDMSSAYGVFSFGILPANDPRLKRAFETSVRRLSQGISIGGIARYEGDEYYRTEREATGNPWAITTLWYAEYLIANAKHENDFDRIREIFTWVAKRALPSGVLSEQFAPSNGVQISAAPLTWSHAAYVTAILKYLDRLEDMGVCVACNPAP